MQYDHEYAHKDDLIDDEANNSNTRFDAYTCDERYARDPDVSGSWRAEYRAQGVDPNAHEDAPELVTDGGVDSDTDDRPTDCICWDDTSTLPCFPCYRAGFNTPNSNPPEQDTDLTNYPATIGDTKDKEGDSTLATVATDGGTGTTFEVPEAGDVVHDHGDGDRLLVISTDTNTTAGSKYIDAIDATVASVNPEYSPHAPTATCVYCEEVEAFDPEATFEEIRHAIATDEITSYTFPVDRLGTLAGDADSKEEGDR